MQELSHLLKVTPSNIRHHISALIKQGSIIAVGHGTHLERGRPSVIYSLIKPVHEENMKILVNILLHKLSDGLSPTEQESNLRWIAHRLANRFPATTQNPTQRLYTTIQILNELNYRAQWEAHIDAPRIILRSCPYRAILDEHPEMCSIDKYLLECLTGNPTSLVTRLKTDSDGRYRCVFRLNKK